MFLFLFAIFSVFAGPLDDVRSLTEFSYRVAGTQGGAQAQSWALGQLVEAGYRARLSPGPIGAGAVVACQRGQGSAIWIVAHSDTVAEGTPGVIDNAAGVAVLLEVARRVQGQPLKRRACFAVTDGEERGLQGARVLANSLPEDEVPALVIALELLGQGEVVAMGLSQDWGYEGLSWLSRNGVGLPYDYRVFSILFPSYERSDHRPFADIGVPSVLILGRSSIGVYWPYHTSLDGYEQLEPDAMAQAVEIVVGLLRDGPPVQSNDSAFELPIMPIVVSGKVAWGIVVIGIISGIFVGFRHWKLSFLGLGIAILATGVGWLAGYLTGFGKPVHAALAGPVMLAWAIAAFSVLMSCPVKKHGIEGGALASAWLALGFATVHPLLALPWAISAISFATSRRFWPAMLLVLPFSLWVCSAETWRELMFHGLLPADLMWWMPVTCVAIWPIACLFMSIPRQRNLLRDVLLFVVLGAVVLVGMFSEPYSEEFFERTELSPPRVAIRDIVGP